MKRLRRGMAGFLVGLVLFLAVLGAGCVVVPPVQVQANPLAAPYYAIEFLMGMSGMLTGNSADVDTVKEKFAIQLTKLGRNIEEDLQFATDMTLLIPKIILTTWKEFLAGDGKEIVDTYVDTRIPDSVAQYITSNYYTYTYYPSQKLSELFLCNSFRNLSISTTRLYYESDGGSCDMYIFNSDYSIKREDHYTSDRSYSPSPNLFIISNVVPSHIIDITNIGKKVGYGGKAADIDDEKDLTIAPDTETTLSDKIADAKTSDTAITYDDVNDIVNNALAAQVRTDADVTTTPTPDEEPTHDGTVLSILAAIFSLLKIISTNVANFSMDIVQKFTEAMTQWCKLLIDGFAAGDWAIGIKTLLTGMSKAIDDFMPGIAQKLSDMALGIDNWQTAWSEKIATIGDAITTFRENVAANISALGDRIMTGFQEWAESLKNLIDITAGILSSIGIISTIADFVGSIVDSIAEIITLSKAFIQSIADAATLVCDQVIALGELVISIPTLIIDFLTIDVPAIKTAALAIPAVWTLKLKPLTDLVVPLQGISVSSSYEYPVITMDVPPFIQQIYPHSSIVLLDFKDHATIFLTLRLFLRATIWLWFVYFIIRHHIDVRFHIG
ncbi:MAG: hypothetical protein Q4F24_11460 [Eubacteriales bacterium]|nr:hypothetical protein [Eubacteriales bacterium]